MKKVIKSFKIFSTVYSVAYSPNGENFACGCGGPNIIQLCDIKNKKCYKKLEGHNDTIFTVKYSYCGNFILSGSCDSTIKLWNINKDKDNNITTYNGHTKSVNVLNYIPDDNTKFISGSCDNTIKLWDINKEENIYTIYNENKHENNPIYTLNVSPCGKYFICGYENGNIKLWDKHNKENIITYNQDNFDCINTIKYSPCGKYFLSGNCDGIKLWDVKINNFIYNFDENSLINDAIFTPCGKYFLSGSENNLIKLWDINTKKKIIHYNSHQDEITSLDISPNENNFISGSYDNTVKLWDYSIIKN